MRMLQMNFYGDPNLGLFVKASDKLCVAGNFLSEKIKEKIEDVLKVKVLSVTISNTDLTGVFSVMNSNGIVLPKILGEMEIKRFKEFAKEFGLNLGILKSRFTAIGNLILCNDNGAIVSKTLSKNIKVVEDCLCVEAECSSISGITTVGSCGVATNKGCLVHRNVNEKEIEIIEKVLKVPTDVGTANFGSPFVGSCVIANSNGVVVSENTTGPELARLSETLGFV